MEKGEFERTQILLSPYSKLVLSQISFLHIEMIEHPTYNRTYDTNSYQD